MTETSGLIGYTGYVGGTLMRHMRFDELYNSVNVQDMTGRTFDLLVCAGASAAKWRANNDPQADRAGIAKLIEVLQTVRAREFVLVSTIDVYPDPGVAANEDTVIEPGRKHPYGRHRYELEQFVTGRFPLARIVRLPALFGTGLRKNLLYDLLNGNLVTPVDRQATFQWYPLRRLASDLDIVRRSNLTLVNLFTAPVAMSEIIDAFFFGTPTVDAGEAAPHYDLRTKYSRMFSGPADFILDVETVLGEMARFVAAERASSRGPVRKTA